MNYYISRLPNSQNIFTILERVLSLVASYVAGIMVHLFMIQLPMLLAYLTVEYRKIKRVINWNLYALDSSDPENSERKLH